MLDWAATLSQLVVDKWQTVQRVPPPLKDKTMGYLISFACFAAWLTHVFTCFSQSLWGFLLAGAIMFPIGILHGFYLWFQ